MLSEALRLNLFPLITLESRFGSEALRLNLFTRISQESCLDQHVNLENRVNPVLVLSPLRLD
jgi:hypothetical protein